MMGEDFVIGGLFGLLIGWFGSNFMGEIWFTSALLALLIIALLEMTGRDD